MFHIVKGIISFVAVCAVLTYHQLDGLKTVHRTVFLTPFRIPLCSTTKITTACWLWSFSVELITGFECGKVDFTELHKVAKTAYLSQKRTL